MDVLHQADVKIKGMHLQGRHFGRLLIWEKYRFADCIEGMVFRHSVWCSVTFRVVQNGVLFRGIAQRLRRASLIA